MLKEYNKDFNGENKKNYQSKKAFSNILIPTLILGILSLAFMLFTVVGLSATASGGGMGGMTGMLMEMLGLPFLGASVALFILTLKRFRKKKIDGRKSLKIINKSQLGFEITSFALLFVFFGVFSASTFANGASESVNAVSKALNAISETTKYLLIVSSTINVSLIVAMVAMVSVDLSKHSYGQALKTLKFQCDYLSDEKSYVSVNNLLKEEEYSKASETADAIQKKYIAQRKEDIENSHLFVKTLNLKEESKFDGNIWQLLGWTILGNLVAFITLGILYPIKVAWVEGWKINHRSINGKQLRFDGNGFQLLGKYILWWLLSVVTLGIYTIFLPKKIQQWLTSHTHFVNFEKETEENKKLLFDNGITTESKFEGKILSLLGWRILGNLVTFLTLGILYTVKLAWIQRWKINGQIINGLEVRFDGNGFQLLGKYILWWLLSIVTLGIYVIFLPVKIEKWISKHTHFKKVVVDESI